MVKYIFPNIGYVFLSWGKRAILLKYKVDGETYYAK